MVYPKQIHWNGKCSAHPARTGCSQRELVAASLLRLPAERVRETWPNGEAVSRLT